MGFCLSDWVLRPFPSLSLSLYLELVFTGDLQLPLFMSFGPHMENLTVWRYVHVRVAAPTIRMIWWKVHNFSFLFLPIHSLFVNCCYFWLDGILRIYVMSVCWRLMSAFFTHGWMKKICSQRPTITEYDWGIITMKLRKTIIAKCMNLKMLRSISKVMDWAQNGICVWHFRSKYVFFLVKPIETQPALFSQLFRKR